MVTSNTTCYFKNRGSVQCELRDFDFVGSYLTVNIAIDIRMKTMDFMRQVNAVFLRFHFADRALKTFI